MRNNLKIVILVIVLAILGALVVLGYKTYLAQKAQVPQLPYTTSVTPEPTRVPTGVISESDKTGDIGKELETTTLQDLEGDLSSLEQEAAGL